MKSFTMLAALTLLLVSCDKDDKEKDYLVSESPVTKTELASPPIVGTEAQIMLQFMVYNGCGEFHAIKTNKVQDTTFVIVQARYRKNQVCTQAIEKREVSYMHKVAGTGRQFIHYIQNGVVTYRDTIPKP